MIKQNSNFKSDVTNERLRQNVSNLYIITNNIINCDINMYKLQYFADASPILMEKIPETDIISS